MSISIHSYFKHLCEPILAESQWTRRRPSRVNCLAPSRCFGIVRHKRFEERAFSFFEIGETRGGAGRRGGETATPHEETGGRADTIPLGRQTEVNFYRLNSITRLLPLPLWLHYLTRELIRVTLVRSEIGNEL